jgi:hypothetical protein
LELNSFLRAAVRGGAEARGDAVDVQAEHDLVPHPVGGLVNLRLGAVGGGGVKLKEAREFDEGVRGVAAARFLGLDVEQLAQPDLVSATCFT